MIKKLYRAIESLQEDGVVITYKKTLDTLKSFFINKYTNSSKTLQKKENCFKKIDVKKEITVAFAVSDAGENVAEGDFFTAQELAFEMQKFGWNILYLRQKKDEWYKIPKNVDVLISLLDGYDLTKVKNPNIITIGWARNWFDAWVKNDTFNIYDLLFASSETACKYITTHSQQKAILLPIATNVDRFNPKQTLQESKYLCDYCFTGSYWGSKREIITFINPQRLPQFTFHIYGKNWDQIEKFKAFNHGFLDYKEMPFVYANTKIVIDDANHVTKPYGAVNSRVFDALASGTLVITNGKLGSEETFQSKLPYFTTEDELYNQLLFYLTHEDERIKKIAELREIVLKNHSYAHRALTIKNALKKNYQKISIAIKIPAPNWSVVHEWGDYHFAVALKKEFEKLGYCVVLQVLEEWENSIGNSCDIVLVLRGLSKYTPKKHQINLMWNISHPDAINTEEYKSYDTVFIASHLWAKKIQDQISTPVETMLQCSDTTRFKLTKEKVSTYSNQLLFVGNSRRVYRKIIQDLLPTPYQLSIYGNHWENFVDAKYIKGIHIENKELYKYYSNADIVLNDHWDDMKEKGFISNRIFDVIASGGFVITDRVEGIEEIFGNSIVTYTDAADLKEKINFYLENEKERKEKVMLAQNIIASKHRFQDRALQFSQHIKKLMDTRTK